MNRIITFVLSSLFLLSSSYLSTANATNNDRHFWVKALTQISRPVIENLSQNTLKQNMPYESRDKNRQRFSHLEAVGRTICGIAPWLELGPDESKEGQLRKTFIEMTVKGLSNAVNPESPDYLLFAEPTQALVDAAFLAEGLLRAPNQIWKRLDPMTQERLITELKRSRSIRAYESNWLLFSSIIEAALLEFTGDYDSEKLFYGIRKFRDKWYKGDALYGDGPEFHYDYYNSYVIHPMLTEIMQVLERHNLDSLNFYPVQKKRMSRYAEILERNISPEGPSQS